MSDTFDSSKRIHSSQGIVSVPPTHEHTTLTSISVLYRVIPQHNAFARLALVCRSLATTSGQNMASNPDIAAGGAKPVSPKSRNRANLDAYRALGKELPTCVNPGCTRFVAVRHWNDGLIPSLKTECTTCSTARKKGKPLPGITCVKKHACENSDGRLGFSCPCDPARYAELPSDCYHMDHINGNHSDNRMENIMTLCMLCHTIKGKRDGDFNGSKSTSLRFG